MHVPVVFNPMCRFGGRRKSSQVNVRQCLLEVSAATGFKYSGDIEGESTIRYLLQYNADGRGDFVGWEQLNGRIGDRTGSILLKHVGRFEVHGIEVTIESVPGSGTGELATMSLKSSRSLSGQGPYTVEYLSVNSIKN
jgi:hypothetical protein